MLQPHAVTSQNTYKILLNSIQESSFFLSLRCLEFWQNGFHFKRKATARNVRETGSVWGTTAENSPVFLSTTSLQNTEQESVGRQQLPKPGQSVMGETE